MLIIRKVVARALLVNILLINILNGLSKRPYMRMNNKQKRRQVTSKGRYI